MVERVMGRKQQTAHTKSTARATAKGMCTSTDYYLDTFNFQLELRETTLVTRRNLGQSRYKLEVVESPERSLPRKLLL